MQFEIRPHQNNFRRKQESNLHFSKTVLLSSRTRNFRPVFDFAKSWRESVWLQKEKPRQSKVR